ncbi:GNAT family N-acetyltransferase [Jatrophihabitans sp.]|uniref:GNAT family N-acetyltransferase n=1 Tax=Jatrophihabitans sp. TaxID=1932789 RepID=UPI002BB0734E|nr:GNAT family N-acetyltransferase [Jatrophihabitans sp.]
MSTAAELLDAYHRQVRGVLPVTQPEGVTVDRDGPLLRVSGGKHWGYVEYRDLAGLTGPALDELIERTRAYFGSRGERFEWKTHSYDEPADLPARLTAAGFSPGEAETVVVGLAEELTGEPQLPDAVRIRRVSEPADFDRIGALHTEIWNEDWTWLAADLAERQANSPDHLAIFAAEAGPQMISVAWLVRDPGSEFATLWGGATRPEWRGKGIYRALVARRARFAVSTGARYLQVDASDDSAPILQRLGFVAVATTTPYLWTPPQSRPEQPPGQAAAEQPSTLGR